MSDTEMNLPTPSPEHPSGESTETSSDSSTSGGSQGTASQSGQGGGPVIVEEVIVDRTQVCHPNYPTPLPVAEDVY